MRTMWGLVSRFKFGALRYLSHRIDVEVIALITQTRDDSRVLRSLRRFKLASSLLIGRRAALVTFNVFEKRVALLFVSDMEKEELISNLIWKNLWQEYGRHRIHIQDAGEVYVFSRSIQAA